MYLILEIHMRLVTVSTITYLSCTIEKVYSK